MNWSDCSLYSIRSKRVLYNLLGIKGSFCFKQNDIASLVDVYVQTNPARLIEAPQYCIKTIQRRINNILQQIEVPEYVFSGIKGKSSVDNAKIHAENEADFLFKIDISSFFPSIRRNVVYRFFNEDLRCSPDVAAMICNFLTIDLEKAHIKDPVTVEAFLESKKIKSRNHLITGSLASVLLSYLVNYKMFEELKAVSDLYGLTMTVYVDDITFSGKTFISKKITKRLQSIVTKHGYNISKRKTRSYGKSTPKLVTGVVIKNKTIVVKNSLRLRIISEFNRLLVNPANKACRRRLQGLLC